MTPAQEAREYAAQHGFDIVVEGRRYAIWTNYEGDEHQNCIATVGGYPAALNAMRRHVAETAADSELQADTAVAALQLLDAWTKIPPMSQEQARTSVGCPIHIQRRPWFVLIDDVEMGCYESYRSAVRRLRQLVNIARRAGERVQRALIKYRGGAL